MTTERVKVISKERVHLRRGYPNTVFSFQVGVGMESFLAKLSALKYKSPNRDLYSDSLSNSSIKAGMM
tara:strand:+ start:94 stop:297 length:204 start_codon:yes stop_codon:yes gene_type:complete